MPKPSNTPLVLVIRDGWGENPNREHDAFNAVRLANTPVDAALRRDWPWTLIHTSGEDVGLPEGTVGNSEVGHQNIGAGRIVDQESVRITKACRAGTLGEIGAISGPIARSRDAGRALHLMGLCSDAGVHGLLTHLEALVRLCRELRQPRVHLHLFTDGRDTGPFTGAGFIAQVEAMCREIGIGRVASVMGRYYAMDRDHRWERVARAYRCLCGRGDAPEPARAATAEGAVKAYYDRPSGETLKGDEFVTPTVIGASDADIAAGRIADGDAVIFYNYRGDRPREIISAFVLPDAEWAKVRPSPDSGRTGFPRATPPKVEFVTMTAYADFLNPYVRVAFPKPPRMANILGEYIAANGLTQYRCAETEKYPHVTFFFNDYREAPFEGEHRENPPSPRVATYDLMPEMSAPGVRDAVLGRLRAPDVESLIVVNFANGDMVGHTGNLAAAIRAVEVVDECVGRIIEAALARRGSLIITADHGNAEQMWDPATNAPHTAHTLYDVPLSVVGAPFKGRRLRAGGRLADIAPTVLAMMGLSRPPEMTGESLLA